MPVLVVNDNWRLAPWADVLYACDGDWWSLHNGVPDFPGQKWTRDEGAARRYGLEWIRSENKPGLSDDPYCIYEGGNSGYQALNLAVLFGARKIILLGYEMWDLVDGKNHWFRRHPEPLVNRFKYAEWRAKYREAKVDLDMWGIEVVNCSTNTALDAFPVGDIREVLQS